MKLFNTLTRTTESVEFDNGVVRLYVCGVTPYDTTHVGHARTYLVFDVLIRHLIHKGLRVDYVQNITDVDESIVRKATELGEQSERLGDRYIERYMEDVAALGMIPALYPRATEAIDEMLEVIRRLLATGHAYVVDGDVFFRVSTLGDAYGRLSRLDRKEMIEAERGQDAPTVDDPRKEDPLDFPLWRGADDDGPSWPSPWSRGRPGWHLECSTLALKHLGKQLDIHGGGADLVFPHHEGEIAQSEAITGLVPFARVWMHVEMARLGGHKMSKSDGNMVFVKDLLVEHPPDAVRLYLLNCHYRHPLDYDEDGLRAAAALAERLRAASTARLDRLARDPIDNSPVERFLEALDDDLDTPRAIEVLDGVAAEVEAHGRYGSQRQLRTLAAHLGLGLS